MSLYLLHGAQTQAGLLFWLMTERGQQLHKWHLQEKKLQTITSTKDTATMAFMQNFAPFTLQKILFHATNLFILHL